MQAMNPEWITWMKAIEAELYDEYTDSVFDARHRLAGYKLSLELDDINKEWSERIERMMSATNKHDYILAMES